MPDAVQAFLKTRPKHVVRVERKVESGRWFDDWSSRARYATLAQMQLRKDREQCKARPTDSRKNRGAEKDADMRLRFVPWCERR